MDRRDFITGSAAPGALPLGARAQPRPRDALIVANEFGPSSLDIQTLGANRASDGTSWLACDRRMTCGQEVHPRRAHVAHPAVRKDLTGCMRWFHLPPDDRKLYEA